MPVWLQAIFALTVLASLVFVVTGAIAVVKSRGRILRPWLLLAVGAITLMNVYLLTAPVAPSNPQGPAAAQES